MIHNNEYKENAMVKLIRKLLVITLCVLLTAPLFSVSAEDRQNASGSWQRNGIGWWYAYSSGGYPAAQWEKINNRWYHFNSGGYMETGWKYIDNYWYFLTSEGSRATGWLNQSGTWYYLNNDGKMLTGWQKINGEWYYLYPSGAMATGWIKSGNTWYLLAGSGKMLTGWVTSGGSRYYMDDSGAMKTGWQKIDGEWYFMNSSGAMCTGWLKSGSQWYLLASDGHMLTGWQKSGGYWYYMDSNGSMRTGWLQDNGDWYYLKPSGEMVTGSYYINGTLNEFDSSGKWIKTLDDILIVANKKHKLPDGYVPSGLRSVNVSKLNSSIQMKDVAATAMEQMFAAAAKDGVYLKLGSGYRSEETQRSVYAGWVSQYGAAVADTISARPGYSDHQTGLAADISDYSGANYLYESFENTSEGIWLRNHAHEYGFIMRYPKGKEAITGYAYEPWHFRYIGVDYATKIHNINVWYTFEEYFGIEGGDYY